MTERLTLTVDNPETSMNLGAAYTGTAWHSDGFTINTVERAWMDATGDTASSTFGALSNGGSGTGQLLLQSLKASLYLFGRDEAYVAANESLLVAAPQGIKLCAGIDKSIRSIRPDDDDPSMDDAAAYADALDAAASAWTAAELSVFGAASVLGGIRALAGLHGNGNNQSSVTKTGLAAATMALAGGAVTLARESGSEVPGMHIVGARGVVLGTGGFASVHSVAGFTAASPVSACAEALVESSVLGGVGVSVHSGANSNLMGRRVTVAAGLDVEVASRMGNANFYGAAVDVGSPGGSPVSQLPTLDIDLESLKHTELASAGTVTVSSAGDIELDGNGTYLESEHGGTVTITGAGFVVTVTTQEVSIAVGANKIGADMNGISAEAGGVAITSDNSGVAIGGTNSQVVADTVGKWLVKAPMVTIL